MVVDRNSDTRSALVGNADGLVFIEVRNGDQKIRMYFPLVQAIQLAEGVLRELRNTFKHEGKEV